MEDEKLFQSAEKFGLCTEECDFLEDKTIWVAALSNGLVVRQDDYRSGRTPDVAWLRLGNYCVENDVDIIGLHLKFRSHVIPITSDESIQGHYFSYGIQKEIDESITKQHYVCGFARQNTLDYDWYKTPELTIEKTVQREINKDDISSGKLILKKKFRSLQN